MDVVIDGENVRRSLWPNLAARELVALATAWAEREGVKALLVFDGAAPEGAVGTGSESADDWITRYAEGRTEPYWLVTSDRELRERAGARAARTIGGGAFARMLSGR